MGATFFSYNAFDEIEAVHEQVGTTFTRARYDKRFEKCQDQADSDWAFCNTRVIKERKSICRASTKERFAFWMRTGVTGQPPLVWQ